MPATKAASSSSVNGSEFFTVTMPLVTRLMSPTPSGNTGSLIGDRTDLSHRPGSAMMKGRFATANTPAMTPSMAGIRRRSSLRYSRMR